VPAPSPKPTPTARQILAKTHPKHLHHGASYQRTRPDGAQVYACGCGDALVVKAADLAKL